MKCKIQIAVDSGVPTQLSYGFVCGFCSGFSLKKAGKVVAVVCGLGFMSLQSLSYAGYIKVDQEKIKNDVESIMDLNNDGKVDSDDVSQATNKIMNILSFNLPAGGGFSAGFIAGLRSGWKIKFSKHYWFVLILIVYMCRQKISQCFESASFDKKWIFIIENPIILWSNLPKLKKNNSNQIK